ncbi:hepatocyte nuclear factor 4-beta-like, partial [Centruroides sculpturatus]|uniref:hepatocyte nuclear factor 4-beta-like n=1 Tax=Centruroides sculpturatus TaxID=218467 RepID=UPI000C6CE42F
IAICPICHKVNLLGNKFGLSVCHPCNSFFEATVKHSFYPLCDSKETCEVKRADIKTCDFCRMSKCYARGMQSKKVILGNDYKEKLSRRLEKIPTLPYRLVYSWHAVQFQECLLLMEQHYYQWLHLSEGFESLSDVEKELIKRKSCIRGTALQIIERSLPAHDVLWLHNCFFDPASCVVPSIRAITLSILSLVIKCREINLSDVEFMLIKLKLALRNDVSVRSDGIVFDFINERINWIEDEMKLYLKYNYITLRYSEDPSLILTSRLFRYPLLCCDVLPEHTINILK